MKRNSLKLLMIILLAIVTIKIASAYPIYVKPMESGKLQPEKTFTYKFDLTHDEACSLVIKSSGNVSIITDKYGIGFYDFNITGIQSIPRYLCEYRNGELRKAHLISDHIFYNLFTDNIFSNNWSNVTIKESQIIDLKSYLTEQLANNLYLNKTSETIYLSTYNESYNLWAYNQTIPALNYTDSKIVFVNDSSSVFIKEGYPKNLKIDNWINSTNLFVKGDLECPRNTSRVVINFTKVSTGDYTFTCNANDVLDFDYEVFTMKKINEINTFSANGTRNQTTYNCGSYEGNVLVNVSWENVDGATSYFIVNHIYSKYKQTANNFFLDKGEFDWVQGTGDYNGFSPTCTYNNTINLNGKLVAGGVIVGTQEIMMDNVRAFLSIPSRRVLSLGNNSLNTYKENFFIFGYDNGNNNFSAINDVIIFGKNNFNRLFEGAFGLNGQNYIAIGEDIEKNTRRLATGQVRVGFNIRDLVDTDSSMITSNIIGSNIMRNGTGGAVNLFGSNIFDTGNLSIVTAVPVNVIGTNVLPNVRTLGASGGMGSYISNLVQGSNIYWFGDYISFTNNVTNNAMGFGRGAIIPHNNTVVFGSSSSQLRDFYLGAGRNISSANFNVTIHSTGGGGNNSRGANLYFKAGSSTGNAEPSWIGFLITNRTVSGPTEQNATEVMRISNDGVVIDYRNIGNNNAIPLTLFSPRGGNLSVALIVHGNLTLNGSLIFLSEAWDKRRGSALNYLESLTNCTDNQGKLISHNCFGISKTEIKDKKQTGSKVIPKEIEECETLTEYQLVKTKNRIYYEPKQKEVCTKRTINITEPTFEETKVEGYDFEKDYAMLREAVYELKIYKEKNERCLTQSNNFVEYKNCMR